MNKQNDQSGTEVSRRNFIKASAAVSAATILAPNGQLFAAGSDKIRVGVIGCGGRGTGAAHNMMEADESVEIVAMCDLFADKVESSLTKLKNNAKKSGFSASRIKVTPETTFTGFNGYKKLLKTDIDIVILACSPGMRPRHLKAAVEAGKNVFMEKPVAVDPVGIRSVIASSKLAKSKGLGIVAGTQRRHQEHYIEVMKRIHNGQIGEVVGGQFYWNGGGMYGWGPKDDPTWSEMERQCRRWYFYAWICGDHIVEQHVHNIDVMNWAFNDMPDHCMAAGGRQVRTAPEFGNIYDHFNTEFAFANGARAMSMCRHWEGADKRISERIVGTKGVAYTSGGFAYIEGEKPWKHEGDSPNPYVVEHADLIASIRKGKPLNEGECVAKSTLCAIMGRMSAYTGRSMKFEWALQKSQLDLSPAKYAFGDLETDPVAIPGITKLV